MPRDSSPRRALTLLLLTVLLTSCAVPVTPPSVAPAAVPALPPQARQTLLVTPSECLPTCSAGLTRERECWRKSLMNEAPPASCVSVPSTDYSLPAAERPRR